MTTYTAIPGTDIDTDSPITESLMTKLRDNPIAITEGSTSAPKIQTAAYATGSVDSAAIATSAVGVLELAPSAVHQNEIFNAFSEQSSVVGAASTVYVTLTGGFFTFGGLRTKGSNALALAIARCEASILGASYSAVQLALQNASAASYTIYATTQYVAASPPYDMGDGDMDFFLMACIDANGDILGTYAAPDPVWFHNGKAQYPITRKEEKPDGSVIQYTCRKDMSAHGMPWKTARNNINTLKAYQAAFKNAKDVYIPLTREMKNENMNDMPHPFAGLIAQRPGARVVMLDPFSTWMQEFQAMRLHDEFSMSDIIDHIDFSAAQSSFIAPPGVVSLDARFK